METPAPDSNLVSPSGAPSPSPEPPKTSIPTTIGILNIIFGSLMMLCILCSSMYLAVMGAIGAPINAIQQQQFQQALQTERLQKLQRLREQEQAAKDEKEKADLKAKQKALEEQPLPKMPDFTKFMREQSFVSFMIADYVSGLILNLAMVISGIGLLRRKEWGRVSGIWVAILKIVRLIVLYTIYALVVVPEMARGFTATFQEMFDDMAKAAPGQKVPGPDELAQMGTFLGIIWTASAIGMMIFGAIYPIVVWILLTRPRVKTACAWTVVASNKVSGTPQSTVEVPSGGTKAETPPPPQAKDEG